MSSSEFAEATKESTNFYEDPAVRTTVEEKFALQPIQTKGWGPTLAF
jgi:hypothetical protein